jgi:hypothetical protein
MAGNRRRPDLAHVVADAAAAGLFGVAAEQLLPPLCFSGKAEFVMARS